MALGNALFISTVSHARLRPKKHAFRYGVYYLCMPLSELNLLQRLWLLSVDRLNLFSLMRRDYGDGVTDPELWARGVLRDWKLEDVTDGEIVLLTMPRLFGYAFNPVSFWFCLDKAGALRAVISEVTNTFRDRHCYVSFRDDHAPITGDDWLHSEKVFHVSPFLDIGGTYQYRFIYGPEKIAVWINHHDAEGLLLTTAVTGKRQALTSRALLYCMLRYPFVVMGLIHFQAIKLMAKGIHYNRRPLPPTTEVTR